MPRTHSERSLIAAVQLVNILDFVMVMPLGPDFAKSLDIPTSQLGYIGGNYAAAAAISGLAGALFLDRFDRREALAVAMPGLVCGTAAGGFSIGLPSLMAARVLTGAFGGPATSVSFSIIADVIPPERCGKALGVVMGVFSVASVFGIPAGIELAQRGGWQLPFYVLALLGFIIIAGLATFLLPSMRGHLTDRIAPDMGGAARELGAFLVRPIVLLSYSSIALLMFGSFLVVPNLSAYAQNNLGYPRAI